MTMLTYTPVLIHGRTVREDAELPDDEFEERYRRVGEILKAKGLEACVVLGSSVAYGNYSYLTGGRPGGVGMAVLVFHASRPAVMLSGLGGARGADHTKAVNYIEDVRFYPDTGEGARIVLAEWGIESGKVGIVGGASDVPSGGLQRIERGLKAFELVGLDEEFRRLRSQKRPREVLELERSAAILAEARDAALAKFIGTASPYKAALEAELVARVGGARDVRTLVNLAGSRELRPITEAHGALTAHQLVLHLALERNGYWVESTTSYPRPQSGEGAAAHAAVEAMRAAVGVGSTLGSLADAGLGELAPEQRELALEIGLGQGVGLGPEPELAIVPGARAELRGGEVLSLRCIVEHEGRWSADSDLVYLSPGGPRRLGSPWWP